LGSRSSSSLVTDDDVPASSISSFVSFFCYVAQLAPASCHDETLTWPVCLASFSCLPRALFGCLPDELLDGDDFVCPRGRFGFGFGFGRVSFHLR